MITGKDKEKWLDKKKQEEKNKAILREEEKRQVDPRRVKVITK